MILLVSSGQLVQVKTREAIMGTFSRRSTHPIPPFLQAPPEGWENPFVALATECELRIDIDEAFRTVDIFFRSLQMPALA